MNIGFDVKRKKKKKRRKTFFFIVLSLARFSMPCTNKRTNIKLK